MAGDARRDPAAELATLTARLAERPGDDAAHEGAARALMALGRLVEAEAEATHAVRLDPDEVRYRELLATIQSRRGEHADAAAEYARLARGDPRQVAWTAAEAVERIEASDAAGGVDAARRAVRLDPGSFEARLALARGLVRLGDAAPALAAARRAAELRPDDATAREVVADALWLAGRPRPALDEFRLLLGELSGSDRARVLAKARSLSRRHAGWLGRNAARLPWLFAVALRRGWVSVR